jgi:1,4-alpha-glucan branching enzyme
MKRLMLAVLGMILTFCAQSQLLTWSPAFPKDNDVVTITVDATKGNQGLNGFSGNVYVHVGAITSLSTGPANWLHAPFLWGSTEAAAAAVPAGPNKWTYTISNPRSFFGLAAGEQLKAIAILFRAGNCTTCAAQRNTDGGDMYVPIYTSALEVRIDQPASQPKYIREPELQNWTLGSAITITANTNKTAAMKLYHDGTVIATQSGVQTISGNSTITIYGNQRFVAESNDGTTIKYDTVTIFVGPPSSPIAPLPAGVRDGINYEPGDTSVTLVLRAPGKNIVTLVGDFNSWTQSPNSILNKTVDGKFFWIRLHPLTPGTEYAYQYIVNNSLKIADPYAEKILDPYVDGSNGQTYDQNIPASVYPGLKPYPAGQTGIVSVLRTAEPAYNWSSAGFSRPDKRNLVIYELLVRDFVAAHDWKTVRDSLGYLKNLGINAIEIMPLNEFEGNDSWGYNPDFYFAPDKYYGTKSAFREFVDSCHKKGIAVIMDIALNHSFGLSPMVQLYWDAVNNRPAADNPWFNPVAKHPFNVGYDMNHASNDTKYYFSRIVEHWLQQYRIDGFRFDLSKGFTQVNSCTSTACTSGGEVNTWGNYDASRIAIWKAYYDTLQLKSPNSYAILEHFSGNAEEKELSDYGMMLWGNMNYSYNQATMGFTTGSDFSGAIASSRGWTNPYLVSYMESHDEERMMYRNQLSSVVTSSYNAQVLDTALVRTGMAGAFFFTIPGPKMIWQFGELGYDYSINTCSNGTTIDNSCRLARKPIRWDYLQQPRRKRLYDVFSSLIRLRSHPLYKEVFQSGTVSQNLSVLTKWMRVTSADTSQLFVVGNFDVVPQVATVTIPAGTWFDYLENTSFSATGSPQNISLKPGEFHVLLNRNVNNIIVTAVGAVDPGSNSFEAAVFPNPATSAYILEINLPRAGNASVELYDALGQRLAEVYKGFLQKGISRLPARRAGVPAGSYFIKITTKETTRTIQVNFQ